MKLIPTRNILQDWHVSLSQKWQQLVCFTQLRNLRLHPNCETVSKLNLFQMNIFILFRLRFSLFTLLQSLTEIRHHLIFSNLFFYGKENIRVRCLQHSVNIKLLTFSICQQLLVYVKQHVQSFSNISHYKLIQMQLIEAEIQPVPSHQSHATLLSQMFS